MQKIFLITNESGSKFYNANDKVFHSVICNCTIYTSQKKATDVVIAHGIKNYKINEITEKEFTNELMIHSTDVILSLEVAKSYLERLRYNVPMISSANKQLAIHMKNMIEKLKFVSPIFQKCSDENEDLSLMAHGNYEELYMELAKVPYFKINDVVVFLKEFNSKSK